MNVERLAALARKIIEAAEAGRLLNPKPLAAVAREALAEEGGPADPLTLRGRE